MSTCIPKAQFRCWQYRKPSTEPVPRWVVEACTIMNGGTFEIDQVEGSFTFDNDGEWLVEVPGGDIPVYACYSGAQFAATFDIVPTPAPDAGTSAPHIEGETS
jgi:hypothetical protein